MMRLVKPSIKYKDSYAEAADAICAEGNEVSLKAPYDREKLQEHCDALNNMSLGIGIPEGNVPETILWLVDDAENFVGRISIRHGLTPHLFTFGGHIGYIIAPRYRRLGYGTKILALGLTEAAALGLTKVLVTCDNTNTASARIIEKNGGILENEWYSEERGVTKLRYWIENE